MIRSIIANRGSLTHQKKSKKRCKARGKLRKRNILTISMVKAQAMSSSLVGGDAVVTNLKPQPKQARKKQRKQQLKQKQNNNTSLQKGNNNKQTELKEAKTATDKANSGGNYKLNIEDHKHVVKEH